jgi:hypothetical protein
VINADYSVFGLLCRCLNRSIRRRLVLREYSLTWASELVGSWYLFIMTIQLHHVITMLHVSGENLSDVPPTRVSHYSGGITTVQLRSKLPHILRTICMHTNYRKPPRILRICLVLLGCRCCNSWRPCTPPRPIQSAMYGTGRR